MTRTISLIITVGAALVLSAPAFGSLDERGIESQSPAGIQARSEALNEKYGLGEHAQPIVSPDALERAVAAQTSNGTVGSRARSEAMNERYGLGEYAPTKSASRLRSEALNEQHGLGFAPDALERAVAAQVSSGQTGQTLVFDNHKVGSPSGTVGQTLVFDNHRVEPPTSSVETVVTGSGSELEWPQIGVAFGIGIALALGLFVMLRQRTRPLAH